LLKSAEQPSQPISFSDRENFGRANTFHDIKCITEKRGRFHKLKTNIKLGQINNTYSFNKGKKVFYKRICFENEK